MYAGDYDNDNDMLRFTYLKYTHYCAHMHCDVDLRSAIVPSLEVPVDGDIDIETRRFFHSIGWLQPLRVMSA